jgi:hypothetical protein
MPQIDYGASLLSGLKVGDNILAARQQQATQAAAQQYKADIGTYWKNPTAQGAAELALRYPQQREAIKQAWDGYDEATRNDELKAVSEGYSALVAGRPDLAIESVQRRIEGRRAAGQDTASEERILKVLNESPDTARSYLGFTLAHIMEPKEFADTYGKLEQESRAAAQAPAELKKVQSEAQRAEVLAKYADQTARLDLAKGAEDIRASKENTRLRAIEAAHSREGNDLKRQELAMKLEEARKTVETKAAEKLADADAALSSIDNMLNTSQRILNTDDSVIRNASGPVDSRLPTLRQSTADFEELINNLGSQAFLAQIPNIKGMGALSNAEGEKLQAALQNFSLRQSPERLKANVKEAVRLIEKARANVERRYGVQTPVDAPARPESSPSIDELVKKYGG